MDLHHLPEGTHSLAPRPGALDRWTFHFNRPRPRNRKWEFGDDNEYDDEEDFQNWSAWQDLHLQPFRFERNASTLGYTRMVPTFGFAPTLCAF